MADRPERDVDVVAALKADMTDAEVQERFDRHVAIGSRGWADPILQAALERVREMLAAQPHQMADNERDDAINAALFAHDGMERLIREGLPREAVEAEPVGFLAALEGLGFIVTARRAAQPSAEPLGLDVERLAEAFLRWSGWDSTGKYAKWKRMEAREAAELIAGHYAAALASEPDRPE